MPITCPEYSLRIRRNCLSMIHCGTICSSKSQNLTLGTQILLILWLQVMYHQGRTKGSSSTKVVSTYGMSHTSSESALMTYSKDVYRWKKASRSSSDATHHHMEDINYDAFRTDLKISQSGFFWPTMYGDTKDFIRRCGGC